jgi:ATP-binding cassette subfamily A (ABC1) protein 3
MSTKSVEYQQLSASGRNRQRVGMNKFLFQVRLLLWKRYRETTKSKSELLRVIMPPLLFLALLHLIYGVPGIKNLFFPDGAEPFFVPFGFWIFIQRMVVQIMFEKSTRMQESMRMMGLSDAAYWISYFLYDGVLLGFIISLLCAIISTGGLFNRANFGVILGFIYSFCLSATTFSFFLTAFFDTPQTAGQAALAILLGMYVMYIVFFPAAKNTLSVYQSQLACVFFPPFALQIGSGAFLRSYGDSFDVLSISQISGILFADVFIYAVLAWYFSQVWPSKIGVRKPFYFPLTLSYWFPNSYHAYKRLGNNEANVDNNHANDSCNNDCLKNHQRVGVMEIGKDPEIGDNPPQTEASSSNNVNAPFEEPDEDIVGKPAVVVKNLRKTFGGYRAVNNLSLKMFENEIFALLGHNGAGKTTAVSILTGLISPDNGPNGGDAIIYGMSILSDMERIRYTLGVCPQHDVLFESLTVQESILFFSQLKGFTYEEALEESRHLCSLFHLSERMDHLGAELSGGQKRKLSVAIAVCGGSKFIVLDEPTAGMDPLARRELWDLLAALRPGRAMCLISHYLDEADVLGDRIAIMSHGQIQCLGSAAFLKAHYGTGYRLTFDRSSAMTDADIINITSYIQTAVPGSKEINEEGSEHLLMYSLPFTSTDRFAGFFSEIENRIKLNTFFHAGPFTLSIISLEDVFLQVGADSSVKPSLIDASEAIGIGDRTYEPSLLTQTLGIVYRRLRYAMNDFITIPLLGLPLSAIIVAAILYNKQVLSKVALINNFAAAGIYALGYLGVPGLVAEFLVKERGDKLRNVLSVMGCDSRAYWLGSFIADFLLLSIPLVTMWISWGAAGMDGYYKNKGGIAFAVSILFQFQMLGFSYLMSFVFTSAKAAVSFIPSLVILLFISPLILIMIILLIVNAVGTSISTSVTGGVLLWGIMITTPNGNLFCAFLDASGDVSSFISNFPSVGACLAFMTWQVVVFLAAVFYMDVYGMQSKVDEIVPVEDETEILQSLEADVIADRQLVSNTPETNLPVKIRRLRKVFPPKAAGRKGVVAVQDLTLGIEQGEIFGLLGANGAGKTTALSMLTRHLLPTQGNAFIGGHSVLTDFHSAALRLGVVTQNNSLWERLSVEDHLFLFARLRGVPEELVSRVVAGAIDQLELTPHCHKLAMRLSGGMKRKLCVAIALIGDPSVVLLDECSAGLDPVSARNLWTVILRTMKNRSVILTSHSMAEVEALCRRIAIMVQGQVRTIGTKASLKQRWSTGVELVVKLRISRQHQAVAVADQVAALDAFVYSLFPTGCMQLSMNGGLVTYKIEKEVLDMGKIFSAFQPAIKDPKSVGCVIEDFTVSHPSLEQVFLRTVNEFTPVAADDVKARQQLHGQPQPGNGQQQATNNPEDQVQLDLNKCGCTDTFVRVLIFVMVGLFILFAIIGIFGSGGSRAAASVLYLLSIIALIVSIVGCSLLCCACCKTPRGADE